MGGSRRSTFWLSVSLLVLSGCGNRVETGPAVPTGPSFVLVTIDTLRADHVGAYGAEDVATPTLDRLAAEGALFETTVAVAPLTLPAHTSILTGLYPPRHGVRHNGIFRVSPDTPTVAQALSRAGWQTGAFVGAAVLDAEFGLDRGFDRYDDTTGADRASGNGYPERSAAEVTDAALAWLGGVRGPYFLWVHYYDPHAAYTPPEPWGSRFVDRPYDGEIAYVDHQLGRLLSGLAPRLDRNDTYVMVTSDHGEGLGEHGEADHSYLVYDADLRVPWIVTGPDVAPRRIETVVSHASVAPTVLGLARLEAPGPFDAPDLSLVLRGKAAPESGWAYAESLAGRLDHGWSALYAIRGQSFHYVRAPSPELYDVQADPRQLANLLPAERGTAAAAVHEAGVHLAGVLAHDRPLETVALGAERRTQIEALGYLVPEEVPAESEVNPRDALPYANLSFLASGDYQAGRLAAAIEKAHQILARFPGSFRMHDIAARAHLELGDLEAALRHARRGTELLPEHEAPWALLGAVHLRRGERQSARAAYESGLARNLEAVDPRLGLMALEAGEDPAAAQAHAEALLRGSELRPELWERIAATWEQAGADDRALELYEQSVRRYPRAPRLRQRLAIQLARRGDDAGAAEQLEALPPGGGDPHLQVRLAVVYAARGEAQRAMHLLRAVLDRDPGNEGARRLLSRVEREASPAGPGAGPASGR